MPDLPEEYILEKSLTPNIWWLWTIEDEQKGDCLKVGRLDDITKFIETNETLRQNQKQL